MQTARGPGLAHTGTAGARSLTIGLLGPVEVRLDGVELTPIRGRWALVLGALALSAGRPVPTRTLAVRVWGDGRGDEAPGNLHTQVHRLRRRLGPATIRTAGSGYVLDLDPDQVDVLRFRRLAEEAAAAEPEAARRLLDQALGLWRGDPLWGLGSAAFERVEVPRLREERLAAVERRIDLDLAAGRHADVVPELRELTGRHPMRESLWHRLIAALSGSGRPAEATQAYHELRGRLREELGMDPSVELQSLFHELLTRIAS